MRQTKGLRLLAISSLLVVVFASTSAAQNLKFGGRVGVSADPSQFFFGAHVETAPLWERLRFRPNVEIGVGDHVTVTTLNFEFAYHFPSNNAWNIYGGGGPALVFINPEGHESHSEGGFNILVGVQHRDGLFVEAKAGALDSPDFKFAIGYVFR